MKNRKKDLIQFFVWMRNGTSFCIAWFLILMLLFCATYRKESISTEVLGKLVLLCIGGVLLFSLCFTKLVMQKGSFVLRLSCFMLLFSIYECFGFYTLGMFNGNGTAWQWIAFVVIVLGLYGICIGIYQSYSKKKGALYTQQLRNYQQRRREENGK